MSFRIRFSLFIGCLFASSVWAVKVNTLNGGLVISNIDFSVPGSAVTLDLGRTYNSITAVSETSGWNGALGWGWTTAFETTLITTAEGQVLLRDGVTGNNIIFKTEKDDPSAREEFYRNLKKAYFEQKMGKKLSATELNRIHWPGKLLSKLKNDMDYRSEMAAKYQIPGVVPKSDTLVSTEFGYQTLKMRGGRWYRVKDLTRQVFDKSGRLVEQEDRNGRKLVFKYSKGLKHELTEIGDPEKTYSLKFVWQGDRVVGVMDSRGRRAKYSYDAHGNLTRVVDSGDQVFEYIYNNRRFPHLITRIDYVSESKKAKVYRELKYDENGLLTFHRDKEATETTYQYGKNQSDPENNFWTKIIKHGNGKTEESYEEYLIKANSDGAKYLHKEIHKAPGLDSTTVFAPFHGKPLQTVKNGVTTNFKYYENGLLRERSVGGDNSRFEYDSKWLKVSKVTSNGLISLYEYDDRGNLKRASNSNKEAVSLKYDKKGRVIAMEDAQSREIAFQYNDFGKPSVITEKGVGTIKLEYDPDGKIKKASTVVSGTKRSRYPDQSKEVVRRVMVSFQGLLALLRPAGVSLNIQ